VKEDFFKFPSTPHLVVLGGTVVRNDKVMSEQERDEFLRHELVVEEKIDGANLGISFDSSGNLRAQNRGAYLHAPFSGQWKKLADWITPKRDLLFDTLADQLILFGEWCYAEHSIPYDQLPDWFLGFDVFDKNHREFLSYQRRSVLLRKVGIATVPILARGRFSLDELKRLLTKSRLGEKPAEGLYLRFDEGSWLGGRAKLVRPEFIQTVEIHWSRKGIKPNRLG
jgi:ATP-dependent RNA circularization protein (DNA/RNA ligase family)